MKQLINLIVQNNQEKRILIIGDDKEQFHQLISLLSENKLSFEVINELPNKSSSEKVHLYLDKHNSTINFTGLSINNIIYRFNDFV